MRRHDHDAGAPLPAVDLGATRDLADVTEVGVGDQARHRALGVLRRLYLFRVAFAVLWAAVLLALEGSASAHPPPGVALALAIYPLTDGLATLVERPLQPSRAVQLLLWTNLVVGLAGAVSILGLSGHLVAEVRVFGVWAILSGGAQLLVGAIRQRSLGGQWLMILSGGGSVVAGTTFATLGGAAPPGLPALAQYSIGGAGWYLFTAGWYLLSMRSVHESARSRSSPDPPPDVQSVGPRREGTSTTDSPRTRSVSTPDD